MVTIKDFASNSIMGVVRKIVNYLVDTLQVQVQNNTDHLPSAFSGSFNDSTKNLTLTIESQGESAENLTAVVNIPTSGGGGTSYTEGRGIDISTENVISVDNSVVPYKADVQDCFNDVTYDSTSNKMTFTALNGQSNEITMNTGGTSEKTIQSLSLNNFISVEVSKVTINKNIDIVASFKTENVGVYTSSIITLNLTKGVYGEYMDITRFIAGDDTFKIILEVEGPTSSFTLYGEIGSNNYALSQSTDTTLTTGKYWILA